MTPRTDFRGMKGAEFQARAGTGMSVAGGEERGEEGAGQQPVRKRSITGGFYLFFQRKRQRTAHLENDGHFLPVMAIEDNHFEQYKDMFSISLEVS